MEKKSKRAFCCPRERVLKLSVRNVFTNLCYREQLLNDNIRCPLLGHFLGFVHNEEDTPHLDVSLPVADNEHAVAL